MDVTSFSTAQGSGVLHIGKCTGQKRSNPHLCCDQRYISLSQVLGNFLELLWSVIAHPNCLHQALRRKVGTIRKREQKHLPQRGRWATAQILHHRIVDAKQRLSSPLNMHVSLDAQSREVGHTVLRTPSGPSYKFDLACLQTGHGEYDNLGVKERLEMATLSYRRASPSHRAIS